MKAFKGLSGIFIALAIFYTVDYFVSYLVAPPLLLGLVLLGFIISFLMLAYPRYFFGGLLILAILGLSILLVDVSSARIEAKQDLTQEIDGASLVPIEQRQLLDQSFLYQLTDIDFHKTKTAKWVKKDLINRWFWSFGDWLVYDRISSQLLWGEDPNVTKSSNPMRWQIHLENEKFFAILSGLVIGIISQLLLSPWLGFLGLFAPLVAFMVLWYIYVDLPGWIYGLYMFGLMFYGISRKAIQMRSSAIDKQGNTRLELKYYRTVRLGLTSILVCGLLVMSTSLLVGLLPLKGINQVVDFALPNIWGARTEYDTREYRLYSLGNSPYQSSSGPLGGPVRAIDNQTPLFWLEMQEAPKYSVYLKSQIKHVYNGKTWLKSEQTYRNNYEYYFSVAENAQWVKENDKFSIEGRVVFDTLKTISLFTPTGFYNSSLDPDKVFLSQENQGFFKGGIFVSFIEAYAFKATQRDFTPPIEDDLSVSTTIDANLLQSLKGFGRYGRSPQERVALMARFLKTNYTYNLEVDTKRQHPDFVTNFLLHSREGYCTYFASAMAIMARANGIPARYVEGFRVDPSQYDAGSRRAKVTEADAHAWVEVYFEGEGWRVVEATAPFQASALQPEEASAEEYARAQEALSGVGNQSGAASDDENADAGAINGNEVDADLGRALNEDGRGYDDNKLSAEDQAAAAALARIEAQKAIEAAKQARLRYFIQGLIVAVILLMVFMLWWLWPVITRFKRIDLKKLTHLIYDYEVIFSKTQGRLIAQGGYLSSGRDLSAYEDWLPSETTRATWERVLFAPAHLIGDLEQEAASRSLMRAYGQLFEDYYRTNGLVKYWIFRLRNRV